MRILCIKPCLNFSKRLKILNKEKPQDAARYLVAEILYQIENGELVDMEIANGE